MTHFLDVHQVAGADLREDVASVVNALDDQRLKYSRNASEARAREAENRRRLKGQH